MTGWASSILYTFFYKIIHMLSKVFQRKLLNNPWELQISWNSFFKMAKHEVTILCFFKRIWVLSEQYNCKQKPKQRKSVLFKEYSLPCWKNSALREMYTRRELWSWMFRRQISAALGWHLCPFHCSYWNNTLPLLIMKIFKHEEKLEK